MGQGASPKGCLARKEATWLEKGVGIAGSSGSTEPGESGLAALPPYLELR